MDKKTGLTVVGSQVLFGTGVGFAMNRVDEYWSTYRTNAGKSTAYYQKIGPYLNIFGGLTLVVLGVTGKVLHNDMARTLGVVGGGAMISNGLLNLVEGMYAKYKSGGTAGKPGQRMYLPMQARSAAAMSPKIVDINSF